MKLQNTFNGGLNLDINEYGFREDTLSDALNVTLISSDKQEMILQNTLSNVWTGTGLKLNYIPLCVKDLNGIAYIISAEFDQSGNFISGEIGTFPSPDYSAGMTGDIINIYSPLKNFTLSNPIINASPLIDFNSSLFNFSINEIVQMELQESYDKTVNIIFVDNKNDIRIVNSRFTVLPNDKFEIINRIGTKDDNVYNPQSFNTTMQLIPKSNKIMDIKFEGSLPGGVLPSGNYVYYFKFSTQDGNLTDIVGESFNCSVFFGFFMNEIRGGKVNEKTNKKNILTLSNLDLAFSSVKVYYVYYSANQGADVIPLAYEIEQSYTIINDSITFEHTGLENILPIDINTLSTQYTKILSAKTITQSQNRLFLANIKEYGTNVQELNDFANEIKLYQKYEGMESAMRVDDDGGITPNVDNLYNIFIDQNDISKAAGTDCWRGMYANPRNIYEKLGYWSGETYQFGVVYIFPNGSLSNVYLLRGIDNDAINAFYQNINFTGTDGFDATYGENVKGLFRFRRRFGFFNDYLRQYYNPRPNRYGVVDQLNGDLNITGIEVELPTIPQNILDSTIGCFFVRCKTRNKNVIIQGGILNTMIVPAIDQDGWIIDSDHKLWNNYDGGSGAQEYPYSFLKRIPTIAYRLENVLQRGSKDYDAKPDGTPEMRFYDVKFNTLFRSEELKKHFCFISPDAIYDKESTASNLFNKDVYMSLLGKFVTAGMIETISYPLDAPAIPKPQNYTILSSVNFLQDMGSFATKGKASYVMSNNSSRLPFSLGQFSSKAIFQAYVHKQATLGDKHYVFYALNYNDYVGLKLDFDYLLNPENTINNEAGTVSIQPHWASTASPFSYTPDGNGVNDDVMHLVNLYPVEGYRSTADLKFLYSGDDIDFTPISKRYYWNDTTQLNLGHILKPLLSLENNLDANRKITFYNGDCYLNFFFRRLYINAFKNKDNVDNYGKVNIGKTLHFFSEANHNIMFRGIELFDITEDDYRKFSPYANVDYSPVNEATQESNTWRNIRLLESVENNKGYSNSISSKVLLKENVLLPFLQNRFQNRVYYSEQHVNQNFVNAYRNFGGLNYKDYNYHLGEINKILTHSGTFYVIQENGVSILPINERVALNDSSQVFVKSGGVLQENVINVLSEVYGSKFIDSVFTTDNYTYIVDIEKSKIFRVSDRIDVMSDFQIQSFLNIIRADFTNVLVDNRSKNILTYWDRNKNVVYFTFISDNNSYTISYSESLGKWNSFHSFVPIKSFNIWNKLYTFPKEGDSSLIWEHDSNGYCNYYGIQYPSYYEFVVNKNISVQKLYDNLDILSNETLPITVTMVNDNGTTVENVVERVNGNVLTANTRYIENVVYVTLARNGKKRVRDKYCKIKITYSGERKFIVSAVLTAIRQSFN